ncbi:hypothetical protein FDZ61_03475 [Ehrlichia ruminantium]|nr:hypothetical protein FDZ62_03485 [Ehrlichia ruminantium]QLK56508.1 hypothetical protein FDZ61_03475 [Ehrlichia ruminantium]QLK58331.1 hypothetical protein FDZ59_03460 [Ehrlichia ruminantium]
MRFLTIDRELISNYTLLK